MKKIQIKVGIAFLILIISLLLVNNFFKNMKIELQKGPDLYYHNINLANEILPKIDNAMKIYHLKHGEYPTVLGKFFFASLKEYLTIDTNYIYLDSNIKDYKSNLSLSYIKVMQGNLGISDSVYQSFINSSKLFIGLRNAKDYILIKMQNTFSYKIYYVGKNGIDENGEGDDILFKPTK